LKSIKIQFSEHQESQGGKCNTRGNEEIGGKGEQNREPPCDKKKKIDPRAGQREAGPKGWKSNSD